MNSILGTLRDHVIKGLGAVVEGEDIVLQDVQGNETSRFPKHTLTPYQSKSTKKPYDLLAVWTCYKYASLTFGEYVTKCRAEKATMVSTVDKKDLIAFLKGDIDKSTQIVSTTNETTPATADTTPATDKRSSTVDADSASTKKRKLSDVSSNKENMKSTAKAQEDDLKDKETSASLKTILAKEYTHRNRTTILNASKKTFDDVLKMVDAANAETKDKIEKATKTSTEKLSTEKRKDQRPLSELLRQKIHGIYSYSDHV